MTIFQDGDCAACSICLSCPTGVQGWTGVHFCLCNKNNSDVLYLQAVVECFVAENPDVDDSSTQWIFW